MLRYLPTNLSAPEIAGQLAVSVNTVRTHMRHVYDKLGAHRRHEAVHRGRALGLLAPSAQGLTSRRNVQRLPGRVTTARSENLMIPNVQ